jgi:excisionase family DNA binding protein
MQLAEDKLIDLATAAELVGVDPSTLRRAAQKKRLEAQKIGRDWVTTPRAVKAWHANEQLHKFSPRKYRPKP